MHRIHLHVLQRSSGSGAKRGTRVLSPKNLTHIERVLESHMPRPFCTSREDKKWFCHLTSYSRTKATHHYVCGYAACWKPGIPNPTQPFPLEHEWASPPSLLVSNKGLAVPSRLAQSPYAAVPPSSQSSKKDGKVAAIIALFVSLKQNQAVIFPPILN